MNLLSLEQLGDWNPQLLREIKGRLKPRNILIAVAMTLLGQMLLLMSFSSQLPVENPLMTGELYSRYGTGTNSYHQSIVLRDSLGHLIINWQLWWLDVFVWLSVISFFTLLVVGTYQLISDLSREEHRGTLNFIRLSPQSTMSILGGKLLGVPVLLYLVAGLAIPLHLLAGLSAHIPFVMIAGFYAVVVATAAGFYSAALLYGLVSGGLGGFQAWLGSGAVLLFLTMVTSMNQGSAPLTHSPADWLHLFSPSVVLPYLVDASFPRLGGDSTYSQVPGYFRLGEMTNWSWFGLPLGSSFGAVVAFTLLNCGLWTYWIWQSLKRCFHNVNATLLSKRQSYALTACFEVSILGFSLQLAEWQDNPEGLFQNFTYLLVWNLLLCLGLIAALSPHRQVLQDWARYRRDKASVRVKGWVQDLVWGEKSPSLAAVALNLLIISSILIPWIILWPKNEYKVSALWALLLSVNLILIYAAVAQLMLFMKTPKRALWAASTVVGLVVLPPIIFGFLSLQPDKVAGIWLFSAFPWAAVKEAATVTFVLSTIGQWLTLTLLGVQLQRQLRVAGESASKALMSGRPALPS